MKANRGRGEILDLEKENRMKEIQRGWRDNPERQQRLKLKQRRSWREEG